MSTARYSNNPKSLFAKIFLVIAGPLAVVCMSGSVGFVQLVISKSRNGAFFSGLWAGICLMLALLFLLNVRRGRPADMPRFNFVLTWAMILAFVLSAIQIWFLMTLHVERP
ncbi:MAG: hypothetical protein IBJ18_09500 [Phycisphaerales bacterium]|nr:hypothetical protein [Phycisphaerales bacterium]